MGKLVVTILTLTLLLSGCLNITEEPPDDDNHQTTTTTTPKQDTTTTKTEDNQTTTETINEPEKETPTIPDCDPATGLNYYQTLLSKHPQYTVTATNPTDHVELAYNSNYAHIIFDDILIILSGDYMYYEDATTTTLVKIAGGAVAYMEQDDTISFTNIEVLFETPLELFTAQCHEHSYELIYRDQDGYKETWYFDKIGTFKNATGYELDGTQTKITFTNTITTETIPQTTRGTTAFTLNTKNIVTNNDDTLTYHYEILSDSVPRYWPDYTIDIYDQDEYLESATFPQYTGTYIKLDYQDNNNNEYLDAGDTFAITTPTPDSYEYYVYDEFAQQYLDDTITVYTDYQTEQAYSINWQTTKPSKLATTTIQLNSDIYWHADIAAYVEPCNEANAFYQPSQSAITICTELQNELQNLENELDWNDYANNVINYIFLHEVGHAVIEQYDVNTLGGEEDVADSFAAYYLLSLPDSYEDLMQAADFWSRLDDTEQSAWDAHSFSQQRYYNLLCWTYGKDAVYFDWLVADGYLPEERAENCRQEYLDLYYQWQEILTL